MHLILKLFVRGREVIAVVLISNQTILIVHLLDELVLVIVFALHLHLQEPVSLDHRVEVLNSLS